jgi:tetratricopeptide (TPR) repeat protein
MKNQTKLWVLSFLTLLFFNNPFAAAQSAESFFKEGESKSKAGDYEAAIVSYTKAIQADSTYYNAYLRRGFCYGLQEKYDLAVADYTSLLRHAPNHVWAITSRGSAQNKLGNYDLAIEDFNRVLAIDPKNQEAMNNRGWSKKFKGDKDGACKDWNASKKMGNDEAKIILKNNQCK